MPRDAEWQLEVRPVREVERYVDADQMAAARAEADRAFRSREHAWRALLEVRLLHRERDAGRCLCGRALGDCSTANIVNAHPGLSRWEEDQIVRLKRGESHLLPDGHPALLDRRSW